MTAPDLLLQLALFAGALLANLLSALPLVVAEPAAIAAGLLQLPFEAQLPLAGAGIRLQLLEAIADATGRLPQQTTTRHNG